MWEGICAARDDLVSAQRDLHAAVTALCQQIDDANKCAKNAEGSAQAATVGVSGIGARVAMLENGSQLEIEALQQTVDKVQRDAATEQDLDSLVASLTGELKTAFGDVLQWLSALESMRGTLGLHSGLGPARPTAGTSNAITALEKSVKKEMSNLRAMMESSSYKVQNRWFCSLENCIQFARDHVPTGQFQWFIDLISYLTFITEEIVDREELERGEIHEARVQRTPEQSAVISAFRTF